MHAEDVSERFLAQSTLLAIRAEVPPNSLSAALPESQQSRHTRVTNDSESRSRLKPPGIAEDE